MTGGFEHLGPKSEKVSGKWDMKNGVLKTVRKKFPSEMRAWLRLKTTGLERNQLALFYDFVQEHWERRMEENMWKVLSAG